MKSIHLFSLSCFLLLALSAHAQKTSRHIEVEIDPLAYALGGGSGHVAFAWQHQRAQIGYARLPMPEFFRNHEEVEEAFQAISLKWDYFMNRETAQKGWFFGPTADVMFITYTGPSGDQLDDMQVNLGVRGGYRFNLFPNQNILRGLYLTPWVGTSWLLDADDIQLSDQSYSRASFTLFPTVHLGWSF